MGIDSTTLDLIETRASYDCNLLNGISFWQFNDFPWLLPHFYIVKIGMRFFLN